MYLRGVTLIVGKGQSETETYQYTSQKRNK